MGLFLLCLSRNCYCRYGGFGIIVFHSWEHSFYTLLVEKELTMGSAMILKPLREHMIRHGWCEANMALGM